MNRTTRIAAVVLAAAVTSGVGSSVAVATAVDRAKPDHVKVEKGDKGKKGTKVSKGSKADKGTKADKQLRQLLRDIARTDAQLVKVARESRTARIGDPAAAVLANVAADRAALADLTSAVQVADGTSDLMAVRKAVKDVRPQNYNKVVNDLRHALRLGTAITEARAAVDGDSAAPATELDAAQAALDAAVAKALLVDASSDQDELRGVKADLQAAHEALEVVRVYLDGLPDDTEDDTDDDTEGEPVEEEPIEEEPVVDEPVVDEPVMG